MIGIVVKITVKNVYLYSLSLRHVLNAYVCFHNEIKDLLENINHQIFQSGTFLRFM